MKKIDVERSIFEVCKDLGKQGIDVFYVPKKNSISIYHSSMSLLPAKEILMDFMDKFYSKKGVRLFDTMDMGNNKYAESVIHSVKNYVFGVIIDYITKECLEHIKECQPYIHRLQDSESYHTYIKEIIDDMDNVLDILSNITFDIDPWNFVHQSFKYGSECYIDAHITIPDSPINVLENDETVLSVVEFEDQEYIEVINKINKQGHKEPISIYCKVPVVSVISNNPKKWNVIPFSLNLGYDVLCELNNNSSYINDVEFRKLYSKGELIAVLDYESLDNNIFQNGHLDNYMLNHNKHYDLDISYFEDKVSEALESLKK